MSFPSWAPSKSPGSPQRSVHHHGQLSGFLPSSLDLIREKEQPKQPRPQLTRSKMSSPLYGQRIGGLAKRRHGTLMAHTGGLWSQTNQDSNSDSIADQLCDLGGKVSDLPTASCSSPQNGAHKVQTPHNYWRVKERMPRKLLEQSVARCTSTQPAPATVTTVSSTPPTLPKRQMLPWPPVCGKQASSPVIMTST